MPGIVLQLLIGAAGPVSLHQPDQGLPDILGPEVAELIVNRLWRYLPSNALMLAFHHPLCNEPGVVHNAKRNSRADGSSALLAKTHPGR